MSMKNRNSEPKTAFEHSDNPFYKNGAITPICLVGSQSVETLRAKIEELIAL